MDEKEYLTPDTKSFDEQYGQMMRQQLEQLRREKSEEAKAAVDSAEDTLYVDTEDYFDETGFTETDFEKSDSYQREVGQREKETFDENKFSEDDFGEVFFDDLEDDREDCDSESDKDEYIEEEEEIEESEEEEEPPARPRKRRRKRHGCAIAIYCVLAIIILTVVANTPLFAVHKINVKGNKDYTKKQVVAMSGIRKGDNLFRIHKRSIRKHLVNNSYIRDVDLTRTLPDTITITVKERKAMAYLPYGSKNIVIDVNGYVLKVINKKPKLVKIADMSIKSMETGKAIAVSDEGKLQEALEILKLMKQGNLFFKEIKPGRVVMQLCVYDRLLCKGTKANLVRSIKNGTLQGIISDLYKKNINKGTVNVGHGEYISFSPKANP